MKASDIKIDFNCNRHSIISDFDSWFATAVNNSELVLSWSRCVSAFDKFQRKFDLMKRKYPETFNQEPGEEVQEAF